MVFLVVILTVRYLVPSRHNSNEVEASYPTSHTNPETEPRPSLLSNISTRSTDGSVLSSPSRYSSQSSLVKPEIKVLHSSSETANTTHHSSEPVETNHGDGEGKLNADTNEGIVEPSGFRNEQKPDQRSPSLKDDATGPRGALHDTPIGSPYPAFLGPVDFGSDKFLARVEEPMGVDIGSSQAEEIGKVPHMESAIEGSHVRRHLKLCPYFFNH